MYRFSLAQLATLEAIARLGSHAAAAESLNITQPTSTLRIQSLEDALNRQLFEPHGRHVRLTHEGLLVQNYAQRVLKLLDEMQARLLTNDPFSGLVRLGSSETVAIAILPTIIDRLKKRHPMLEISIQIDNSFVLAQALSQGMLDMAILADLRALRHIEVRPLARAPVAWLGHTKLMKPANILTADWLSQQVIYSVPEPSPLHDRMQRWWLSQPSPPEQLALNTCNSLSLLAQIVTNGSGCAVLPVCIMNQEIQSGEVEVYAQDEPFNALDLYLAYPETHRSRGVDLLFDVAQQTVQDTAGLEAV